MEERKKNEDLFLNRQEVIALINTLNQLARSTDFASRASDLELIEKFASFRASVSMMVAILVPLSIFFCVRCRSGC